MKPCGLMGGFFFVFFRNTGAFTFVTLSVFWDALRGYPFGFMAGLPVV